jgi:D-glycero-alpha-D-manno-heptose-7-phosphate kinase
VQDHWAAAFGGVSLLKVDYPLVQRTAVSVASTIEHDLGRSLHTVWFGQPHASSALHDEVIARLELEGAPVALERMRVAAATAARALADGDLAQYGTALVENHEAIRLLHADLLSADVEELAALAASHGARGWKVNGAGGFGGSMVVLGPADRAADEALCDAIAGRSGWGLIVAPVAADGVVAERVASERRRGR